ncbi:MAG: HDIG domain-containing protein [Synergistaceae bacterium]|nr:HDIG domain-containing protein [Synergistaceae bacterium]MDD3672498.1 HDIG domain-containing protein [Synergistaceae bacterium]
MINGEKRQASIKKFISQFKTNLELKASNKQYIAFRVILLAVASMLIVSNWFVFDRLENYRIGHTSAKTYFALTSSRYEDRAATLELRQRAASRIIDVMVQDEKIASEVASKVDLLKSGDYSLVLQNPLLELFSGLPKLTQGNIISTVVSIAEKIKNKSQDRGEQTELIWKELSEVRLSQSDKNVAFQILDKVLNPSLNSDSEMASRLRDDVAVQIPPVVREIRPGEVLVQKGQVVTPSLAKLLASQGYPDSRFPYKHLFFILGAIILWSFWPVWIENGLKEKLSFRQWIYISVILAVSWSLELMFARTGGYSMAVLGMTGWLCLTVPVSLSYHIVMGGGIISVMIAFGTNPGIVALGCILASFSAGIGRILFLDPPNHRVTIWRNLFFLGLCLGAVSVAVHWGLGLFYTYQLPILSIVFSLFWSTVVIALLPIWENLFDVISPLRLLELSHPSQPLLKRLQIEAPGTYHHTLMVGTLAEAAADKLMMNGLLVKAGAYYHDIGKLKNPKYFVENQMSGENIHDELSPSLSGLVLISHVRDGLEIAEETKLPKTIRRFIAEHHGTTVQKYFYEKALALDENTTEEQFRYPGPSPQSRETALVMLADSVEAAVKAKNKSFDNIRDLRLLVQNVTKQKIDSGQLRDVDFTMREMAVIESSFIEILRSTYHSREVKEISESIRAAAEKRGQPGAK